MRDISPKYKPNVFGTIVARRLIELEGTPEAIRYFDSVCERLTNYDYWYFLSTLWVSYTGFSDLNMWKKLFASERSQRKDCIMKPSEVKVFDGLPHFITVYRAHRPDEKDCIAYTLGKDIAFRFAKERNVDSIKEYKVKKYDITALFLRRGEQEVIVLDNKKPVFIKEHFRGESHGRIYI